MGPVPPAGEHTQPALIGVGQAQECVVHAPQLRRAAIDRREQHSEQQRPDPQLPRADTGREQRLDPLAHPGAIKDPLEPPQLGGGDAHVVASNLAISSPSETAGSCAARSPSRWLHDTPAACMNAASPIRSAHSSSHVDRNRPADNRGNELSLDSAADRLSVTLRRSALRPPMINPSPANAAACDSRS